MFQELKGKILLKGKKISEQEECSDVNHQSSYVSDEDRAVEKDTQVNLHIVTIRLISVHCIWILQ